MLRRQLNKKNIVYKMNEAGHFVYVNSSAALLTGYTEDELLGMHFSQLLRKDYKDFAINFYMQQLVKKSPSTYLELPFVKKNGRQIWLGHNVCIESNNGNLHMSATAWEITVKKEKPFLHKTAWQMGLIENLQVGVLVEDNNHNIVIINKAFCRMFNISTPPGDLIGKSYSLLNAFLERSIKDPLKFDTTGDHLVTERSFLIAEQIELTNGNIYERDHIPIYGETGYIGSLWKYRDLTEINSVKNELIKNERKYKSIIDTMRLGLLEVDNDGYIISGNESFCEMLSYNSIDELIGKEAFSTLLDEESQQIMKEQMAQRERGASGAYEIKIKKSNGIDQA
jgi:PAS domain S-box-containing protein